MKRNLDLLQLGITVSCMMSGCVSFQKVNDYAASSLKSLKKYDEIGYSYTRACRDKCNMEQIRFLRLSKDVCACGTEKTADSVITVLYNSVKGYYDGLNKLSANNLTSYKTEALTKVLKSGQFGDLKIEKAEVDAYAKLSSLMLTAITDGYRSKKIKIYIAGANESIQILLKSLEYSLASNLTGKLIIHKQRIESIYFDLVNDSLASAFEKKRAIDEYNGLNEETDIRHKQIMSFSKSLKNISAGHQVLYEHRNKMNAKEIRELLARYASELEDLVSEFNKLKSK